MMKFAVLVFLLLQSLLQSAEASGGTCACEAEELGFSIDCGAQTAMLTALQELRTRGCASDCSSEECEKNYYIVQAHHDFCPEDGIPEEIEDGFHDFDETCTGCKITRQFTDGAPDCPTPNCEDNSGNEAYTALVDADCSNDCTSDACRDSFFMLRIVHDTCEHDTLSASSEEGLHDFEGPCAMQICNAPDGGANQLLCDDDDHDHDDDPNSAAAATTTGAAAALIGFMMLV